jgi:hypothetical protein
LPILKENASFPLTTPITCTPLSPLPILYYRPP